MSKKKAAAPRTRAVATPSRAPYTCLEDAIEELLDRGNSWNPCVIDLDMLDAKITNSAVTCGPDTPAGDVQTSIRAWVDQWKTNLAPTHQPPSDDVETVLETDDVAADAETVPDVNMLTTTVTGEIVIDPVTGDDAVQPPLDVDDVQVEPAINPSAASADAHHADAPVAERDIGGAGAEHIHIHKRPRVADLKSATLGKSHIKATLD